MGGRKGARKHGFVLPFTPPLPTACDLTIIASFDETGLTLKGGEARLPAVTPEAIEARLFPTKTPPLKSMFLVCTARSGSSLLMGRLAAHPNVVAAKHPIHEIRMTYLLCSGLAGADQPGKS